MIDSVRDSGRDVAHATPAESCVKAPPELQNDALRTGRQKHGMTYNKKNVDLEQQLQAHLPGDRRRAIASGAPMPDRVRGAALFADISGFTALTEALATELGAHRGAEELTLHLNRVYHELIAQLDGYGGHVIYFSGDAITCWFDADDGVRAAACAHAMQDALQRVRDILTPGGTRVTLAMKVAIAVGDARRFVVGDPDVQLIDVLAGSLIDALATAEHHAQPGEVM